jgi:hypothetical protein
MYTNPQNINEIGGERQRDALARAEQYRRAQRLRTSSRSAHHRRPMAWLRALTTRRQP